MPSYAFAIGNFRMYLRIGPKPGQTADFRKPARTKAKKEDVSGETQTYGNPKVIWHKAVSCRARIVQTYSPGGANGHPSI